ncbi:MAG: YihY/virulence factor BrkB family protein [Acidobacteria bacterium]|nr:YihY/virulence factor BrkB family protein [Acidobacteriota bacterium]
MAHDHSSTLRVDPVARRVRRLGEQAVDGASLMGRAAWRGLIEVAYSSDDLTHAASIAYYALLSFLPFLLLAFSVLGSFEAGQQVRDHVLEIVLGYFPAQPDFIASQVDLFSQTGARLGVGSLLALVWASMGVFGAITSAVNHAWSVERPRSFWGHRFFSFLMMAAAVLLLFAALFLLSISKMTGAAWSTLLPQFPWLATVRGWEGPVGAFVLFVVVVGLVFYFVPNTKVRLRDVWPGAVVTALAWRGAFEGFSWYLRRWASSSIHGSIATVIWFLLWIYISAVVLLYGVEFTAAFARIRRERREPIPPTNAS